VIRISNPRICSRPREINFFLQIKQRSEKLAATQRINQTKFLGAAEGYKNAEISSSSSFGRQGALKSNPNFYDPGHAS